MWYQRVLCPAEFITTTLQVPQRYSNCIQMLYLIGLGLGDAEDISIKGLEVVKNAKEVYLEAYTSILTVGKDALVRYQE